MNTFYFLHFCMKLKFIASVIFLNYIVNNTEIIICIFLDTRMMSFSATLLDNTTQQFTGEKNLLLLLIQTSHYFDKNYGRTSDYNW